MCRTDIILIWRADYVEHAVDTPVLAFHNDTNFKKKAYFVLWASSLELNLSASGTEAASSQATLQRPPAIHA